LQNASRQEPGPDSIRTEQAPSRRIQQIIALKRKSPACEAAMQALVVAGLFSPETVLTEIRVCLHGSARAFRLLRAAARFFPALAGRPVTRSGDAKKQGRRRSMPPTTLPAPEIEIGSRLPVSLIITRNRAGRCEPVHNGPGKISAGGLSGIIVTKTHSWSSWSFEKIGLNRAICPVCGGRRSGVRAPWPESPCCAASAGTTAPTVARWRRIASTHRRPR
jgi:hypothetical protein